MPALRIDSRLKILLAVLTLSVSAAADVIRKSDDSEVNGSLVEVRDKEIVFTTGTAPEVTTTSIPFRDLTSIHFRAAEWDPQLGRLVVENRSEVASEKSGTIKLRAGKHGIGLMHWSESDGGTFQVEISGPGMDRQRIPEKLLYRPANAASQTVHSKGFDTEGFLDPVDFSAVEPGLSATAVEWAQDEEPRDDSELQWAQITGTSTSTIIGLNMVKHADKHFGVYFSGILQVPADGEYTLFVKSKGHSILRVGRDPAGIQPFQVRPQSSNVQLISIDGGRWFGKLTAWTEDRIGVDVTTGGQVTNVEAPVELLQEIWRGTVMLKEIKIDRAGEPTTQDSIYVTKGEDKSIQRINGKVLGVEGDSLQVEYQGEKRGLKLERIHGVVFHGRRANPPPAPGVLTLSGGIQLPGQLIRVEPKTAIHFKTLWGQDFTLKYAQAVRFTVRNGRTTPLTDLQLIAEEQTPYFDRLPHWTADKSLTGPPLMIAKTRYARGLCLHSRTVLTYAVDSGYSKFQCDVGMQSEVGESGNAAVRILTDGTIAFENLSLTTASGALPVTVDLTGKKTLTLEVDFGDNFDVCDHVTFGEPRLTKESP